MHLIRVLNKSVISDHHYNVLDVTSTLYTVARGMSGLLSLPDGLLRLLRLCVLVHNLGPNIARSDSRGLAAFSETDLQHMLPSHCNNMVTSTDLLNAGITLSLISEDRSGTERASEQSSDSATHHINIICLGQ